MRATDQIKAKAVIVEALLQAYTPDGKRQYNYAQILDKIGVARTSTNEHAVSDIATALGLRRRRSYTRNNENHSGKPRKAYEGNELPVAPDYQQGSLFFEADKARFLAACKAFADIYFK